MPELITTILSVIKIIPEFSEMINKLVRDSKGTKRSLILEMRANVDVIQLYLDGEASLDNVISKLETTKLEKALDSSFNLNTIKFGKVREESTGGIPFYKQYVGWTTEELFENLYLKIKNLQTFVEIQPQSFHVRKNVRLINVLKLIKLLTIHIGE